MMERRFPRAALFTTAGLLIWATDFLFITLFAAIACARGFADGTLLGIGIVPLVSVFATVIAAAATCAVILTASQGGRADPEEPSNGDFLGRLSMIAALVALIAIAFTALPALVLRTCGG
jgi:hypothetical protein